MTYTTHILTGLLAGGTILLQQPDPQLSLLSAVFIGSLIPDIDEPNSYAGRRNRGTSHLIKALFGHRGITHTLFGLFISNIVILGVIYYYKLDIQYLYYFDIGILIGHFLLDLITKDGIPLFAPFYKKRIKIPIFTVGGFGEFVFRTFIFIGLIYLIFNYLKVEIYRFI